MKYTQPIAACSAAVFITMCALQLQAQTPDAGTILKEVPQPISRDQRPIPSVDASRLAPPMKLLPAGGPTLTVKVFAIEGNKAIPSASLLSLIESEVGKPLTLEQLEAVAFKLTHYYRDQGYFVTRAYIPQQEVVEGRVVLRVVEGNYGDFHLKNSSLVRDSTLQAILDHVKPRDIVSLDTLERAMLIINDTPGAAVVRADVMPGQRVGTSDFAVDTVATREYEGFVMADNYGSIYTGEYRLSGGFDWNSPSARGDKLSLFGLASSEGDLLSGQLSYSALLRPNGWRGSVAVAQTQYELGDFYEALDATGTARSIELGVSYPIQRTRARTLEFGSTLALRDLTDEIGAVAATTDKRVLSLMPYLRLRDERYLLGFDGVTNAYVAATLGDLDIGSAEAMKLDQDPSGPQTNGDFQKINAELSRLTLLPNHWSLLTLAKAQYALDDKNLDGSERLAVSGPSAVMAYPSGELLGRNALLGRIEVAKQWPLDQVQQQFSVFTDWGRAQSSTSEPYRTLTDLGVGWSINYDSWFAKAHLAHRLDSDEAKSEPTDRTRFLIQAGKVF